MPNTIINTNTSTTLAMIAAWGVLFAVFWALTLRLQPIAANKKRSDQTKRKRNRRARVALEERAMEPIQTNE